jgi:hypothetical protein
MGGDECPRAFGNALLEFAGDAKQRVHRHLCDWRRPPGPKR